MLQPISDLLSAKAFYTVYYQFGREGNFVWFAWDFVPTDLPRNKKEAMALYNKSTYARAEFSQDRVARSQEGVVYVDNENGAMSLETVKVAIESMALGLIGSATVLNARGHIDRLWR